MNTRLERVTPSAGLSADLQALIASGLEAERAGDRETARVRLESALRGLRCPSAWRTAVDLTLWIGRTLMNDRNYDAAVDCGQLSRTVAELHGDVAGVAHAVNLLASTELLRGNLDGARALLYESRGAAERCGDVELIPMVDQNLGIIANIQGDLPVALQHYQLSLRGFRTIGAEDHTGYVLNNMGMLYTDLGSWREAEEAFRGAEVSAESSGNVLTRVMVEVNRAEMWIARKEWGPAQQACDNAIKLGTAHGMDRALAEVHKFQGIIDREQMRYTAAAEHLEQAAHLADVGEDLLLAAEVARERATLSWHQQRHQETLRHLNHAHRLFVAIRARRDLADVDRRVSQLESVFLEIVHRWGESIESADRYTQGHCQRVADYACALAEAAGVYDERTMFWFRLGALLHDVGKIIVPPEVLNKPGRLDPGERALMERHPDAGVALLEDIEFPWDVRPMVRFHHERWAGGGYPTGVAGEQIPIAARILGIADVYDALTSDRPYRIAHRAPEALEVMREMAPSHFDPRLFSLFEDLVHSGQLGKDNADAFTLARIA